MEENKSVPTQFRLSQSERNFLEKLGKGNLSDGLRVALTKAGFKEKISPTEPVGIPKVRRSFNFEHEEYTYIRIENERPVSTVNIPVSREQEMLNRFGEEIFFEEGILKGLFPMEAEKDLLQKVSSIVDVSSNKVIWKRTK